MSHPATPIPPSRRKFRGAAASRASNGFSRPQHMQMCAHRAAFVAARPQMGGVGTVFRGIRRKGGPGGERRLFREFGKFASCECC